jgi:hypothetical protein
MILLNLVEVLALLHRRENANEKQKNLKPTFLSLLDGMTAVLVAITCVFTALENTVSIPGEGQDPESIDPWRLGIMATEAFTGYAIFPLLERDL